MNSNAILIIVRSGIFTSTFSFTGSIWLFTGDSLFAQESTTPVAAGGWRQSHTATLLASRTVQYFVFSVTVKNILEDVVVHLTAPRVRDNFEPAFFLPTTIITVTTFFALNPFSVRSNLRNYVFFYNQ